MEKNNPLQNFIFKLPAQQKINLLNKIAIKPYPSRGSVHYNTDKL